MSGSDRRVAFLRGINLGNRRITNDRLAEIVEELDVDEVATYQASGNVVFTAPADALDREIEMSFERHLEARLGYGVATLIRRAGELADIATDETFVRPVEEGFKVHVIFLRDEVEDEQRDALARLEGPDDRFPVRGREVGWLRRGRLTDSEIEARHLEKALGGMANTMRTHTTVQRIVKKFGS